MAATEAAIPPRTSVVHRLSTPRAAALAGVLFSVLFAAILLLIRVPMPQDAAAAAGWLAGHRSGITTATVLMPFAGISFLWFLAVVRDGLGRLEDRFYSTVFLGSGLLFLAMMFVATAVAAGLVGGSIDGVESGTHSAVAEFVTTLIHTASRTYALRMAAVFMISLATIWLRTALMPRWLAVLSYLTALALLTVGDQSMWATMAFPVWVLVVSTLILLRTHHVGPSRLPGRAGDVRD